MNIIEVAREAGFNACNGFSLLIVRHTNGSWVDISEELERFAALVRAAALEEAADICDRVNNYDNPMTAGDCADAIRALKEKT